MRVSRNQDCVDQELSELSDHPDRRHLRRNGLMKLVVVIIAILVAIAFAALCELVSARREYCLTNMTDGVCTGDADTSRCDRITCKSQSKE